MTSDLQIIAELRALLDAQPVLARRLDGVGSLGESVEMLARIACENGLPLSAAELRGHFNKVTSGLRGATVRDDDLDLVVGGADAYRLFIRPLLRG